MSKPVYTPTDQTRLAGIERRLRFLERRNQIPKAHPDYHPAGGASWFTAENSGTQTAAGSSTKTLNFTDPAGFYTNDSGSFDLASDHVRILQPGFYALTAILFTNTSLDSAPNWFVEILDVRGQDASSHTEYGLVGTPMSAAAAKDLLPGGGMLTLTYPNFYNLRDDYAYGGTRPVDWPLVMTMRMAWTVSDDHSASWALVGVRHE